MRIAIISPWNPWPVDSGSRQRADLIIRGLASSHDVFVIYGLQQPYHAIPELNEHPQAVAQFLTFRWPRGEAVVATADAPRKPGIDVRPRDIQRMHPFIPDLSGPLATFKPDVILALEADGALIAAAQNSVRTFPIVVDQWEPSRIVDARLITRIRSQLFWRSIMTHARAITVVTNAEMAAAGRILGGVSKVCVVENEALRPFNYARNPAPLTLLFAGNLDYEPNRDGILWFIDDVLPIIQKEMSGVQLQIVGRGALLCSGGLPVGVTQIGWVDDLSACYSTASVAINPVRAGHGSRVKNQCAIVHGVPLVTFPDQSTIASESIRCIPATPNAAQEFAAACLAFLQNPPAAPLPECDSAADSRLVTSLSKVLGRIAGVDA
ncbi:MAG: hypothetical protein RLZ42_1071 [Armatimonadota bacterium]